MATGLSRQSESPPVACSVLYPSNDHIGQSASLPLKFRSMRVFDRRLWVGLYPSSQMYSSFDLVLMAEACPHFGREKKTSGLSTAGRRDIVLCPRLAETDQKEIRKSTAALSVSE